MDRPRTGMRDTASILAYSKTVVVRWIFVIFLSTAWMKNMSCYIPRKNKFSV